MSAAGLIDDGAGRTSCFWHQGLPEYRAYHDEEWGRPQSDDFRLFEKSCLDGFQSGLSWLTILRKREGFRKAFAGFDFREVAAFDSGDVDRLVADAAIVRHRGKIESTINNARRAIELVRTEGSLAAYFWRFEPAVSSRPARFDWETLRALPKTAESIALSKDLKKRGWSFVGPTTVYAFMQAVGLVNDHIEGCWCREVCTDARTRFRLPQG